MAILATKPDHLSVAKTRTVSWLAQFVVQIVTSLGWEEQFQCESVENIAVGSSGQHRWCAGGRMGLSNWEALDAGRNNDGDFVPTIQ